MKLPKVDELVNCFNEACANHKEALIAGETHVRFRREGNEVVIDLFCPNCVTGAEKFGVPVRLLSAHTQHQEQKEKSDREDTSAVEMHDALQKQILGFFSDALYACEVPLCTTAPEPATKMFEVEMGEKLIPICTPCAEQARKAGVKVSDLHATIARLAREARNTVLYEREQKRLALAKSFFEQCRRQTGQSAPATAPAHRDNGFRGETRLTPARTNR